MVVKRATRILVSLALGLQMVHVSAWSPRVTPSTTLSENRRSLFVTASALCSSLVIPVSQQARADTGAEVRGTSLTPFNGLAFQYRGSEFGGLTSSDLTEASIPYAEFMEKLKAGKVGLVEFLAPNGDAAYVTFKDSSGNKPIRIGDGYPTEQHDGFSSPAFAVRAVQNAGVPYKFTVPALAAYKH